MYNPCKLSIVLPCFNPAKGWQENIIRCMNYVHDIDPNAELIIINDGSNMLDIVETENFFSAYNNIQLHSYSTNKGKGYALRYGVSKSRGDLIIYTDIDFPYIEESFKKIYAELQNGSDVAIGTRNINYYTHLPKARVYISKLLRYIIRTFLRIPTDDTQCGLKGFNQNGKKVFLETTIDRYLFDLEFIFLSARKKLNIKTVEVELRPEIVLSKMNWKILMQELGNFLKIFAKSIF